MESAQVVSVVRPSFVRALAVVVVAAVVMSVVGACTGGGEPGGRVSGSASGASSTSASQTPGIALVEWQPVRLVDDNGSWEIPEGTGGVLIFDADGNFATGVCNGIYGRADIEPGRIRNVRDTSHSEVMCTPEQFRLEDALGAILPGWWTIQSGTLVVRSDDGDGVEVTFRERPSVPPVASGPTVRAGERNGVPYRLNLLGDPSDVTEMIFHYRPAPGTLWRGSTSGSGPGGVPMWRIVREAVGSESEYFLAGFAPPGTVRVTHRTAGDDEVDLDLDTATAAPRWVVWSGFLPKHGDSQGQVHAYDDAGRVLASVDLAEIDPAVRDMLRSP